MGQTGKERENEKLIACLLSTNSLRAAATKAGLSLRTVLRRLDDADFRMEYQKVKKETLKMATAILMRESSKAAVTLSKICANKRSEGQGPRVAAARAVLRLSLDAFSLEDLEERIFRLENQGKDAI